MRWSKIFLLYNGHNLGVCPLISEKIPSLYNGQILSKWRGTLEKTSLTLQRTDFHPNTPFEGKDCNKKALSAFSKARAQYICGYEILENSKHSRCIYTCGLASKSGVRTRGKNEHFRLVAFALILSCWEYPNPLKTRIEKSF